MTTLRVTKTTFTSGEIDPQLHGRIDLRAYEEGAARLRNVLISKTGGVSRRPGSRVIAPAEGIERMTAFDRGDGVDLLLFAANELRVLKDGEVTQSGIATPWSSEQLRDLTWVRLDDRLLVCHQDVEPRLVGPDDTGSYVITTLAFSEEDDPEADFPRSFRPFARYASTEIAMQASVDGVSSENAIAPGTVVTLATDAPFFAEGHQGTLLRLKGKEVQVLFVTGPTTATGVVRQELADGKATRDWDEQAFSELRGWPGAVAQHQNRLVLAASRAAPDSLWFSKTGMPFNFDTGEGLSDEAIVFRLRADERHVIRHLFTGRRLQVFTTKGEWVVSGSPLTPSNLQVDLQTRVGSPAGRRITPVDVDGATLFIGASLRDLREFLFTETEQAYQASDLALLSRHLLVDPVDMAFDQSRRLFLIVREDGDLVTVTLDRNSNIAGWSLQSTSGKVRAIAAHERTITMVVERQSGTFLEQWDSAFQLDGAVRITATEPTDTWQGLDAFIGLSPNFIADGVDLGPRLVQQAEIRLDRTASELIVGFPFAHEIEALPPLTGSSTRYALDSVYRPIRFAFRVKDTAALQVDGGRGFQTRQLPSTVSGLFSGDVGIRAMGWRRGAERPPWRIMQNTAAPFTLLSVTTELKVNS